MTPFEQITKAATVLLDAVGLTAVEATSITIEAGDPVIVTVTRVVTEDGVRRGFETTYEVRR